MDVGKQGDAEADHVLTEFLEGRKLIGVHPNENTATVWLKTEDLLDIIKEHGNPVQVLEL